MHDRHNSDLATAFFFKLLDVVTVSPLQRGTGSRISDRLENCDRRGTAKLRFRGIQIVLLATISLLSASFIPSLYQPVADAVIFPDGTVAFDRPPRLVGASTTRNEVYAWGATYYFTLDLLPDAGAALQRVQLAQAKSPDLIRFQLEQSRAFIGTRSQRGAKLSLKTVQLDPETGAVIVDFESPVGPGQQVTIALLPERNPDTSGVYLFGVTAFPAGETVRSQFLGYGRLHFYDNRFRGFPFW